MIKGNLENQISKSLACEVKIFSSTNFGDFFISPSMVGELSERLDLKPEILAKKIQEASKSLVKKTVFEAGYINIYLNQDAYLDEIKSIDNDLNNYLIQSQNEDKTIVFDYSGPNVAKNFSVGHLRSTVIGQANYNIHKALGYKVVGVNHLGDWGTQFGKLIYAIKTWGDESEIAKDPIVQLNALYVRFHAEAENDESLNVAAREWFKKLENGDEEATRIWQMCVSWSIKEFDRVYEILGVKIDNTQGESFYQDKLQEVIEILKRKNLLVESQGAKIVELDNLPPALIQKQDDATLYLTRDLAALKYRIDNYNPSEIIYHIGNDQSLHFQQLEAVAKKIGWLENLKITFAGHGMIRLPEGKMSTRKGQVVLLSNLINEAKTKALEIIDQKNPDLNDKDAIAQKIAICAIKYADLAPNRKSDIVFSFDRMVTFKGNSGPYLQYSYARANSILKKYNQKFADQKAIENIPNEASALAKEIINIQEILIQSAHNSNPNTLCDFTFRLCENFNNYYEKKKIITEDAGESAENIYLIIVALQVLEKLFDLLGLSKLDQI